MWSDILAANHSRDSVAVRSHSDGQLSRRLLRGLRACVTALVWCTVIIFALVGLIGIGQTSVEFVGGIFGPSTSGPPVAVLKPAGLHPQSMTMNGGPVLASPKVYAIYWGPSGDFPSDLQAGMTSLITSLDGSSYLAVLDPYVGGHAQVSYAGTFEDGASRPPPHASEPVLVHEVAKVLHAHGKAPDPQGVYLVFGSQTSSRIDPGYCGRHDTGWIDGQRIVTMFIPEVGTYACDLPPGGSGEPYSFWTQAVASTVTHELAESMTDPVPGTGWVGKSDQGPADQFWEIGDRCQFGPLIAVRLVGPSATWPLQPLWSNGRGCEVSPT